MFADTKMTLEYAHLDKNCCQSYRASNKEVIILAARVGEELPQIESLTEGERQEFRRILNTDDSDLLEIIEANVVHFVNVERKVKHLPPLPNARDRAAMAVIAKCATTILKKISSLSYYTKIYLSFREDEADDEWSFAESWKPVIGELRCQASRGALSINTSVGRKKETFRKKFAYRIALSLHHRGHVLHRSEHGEFAECIRKAFSITNGVDCTETMRGYVEYAIAHLISRGGDPLDPRRIIYP